MAEDVAHDRCQATEEKVEAGKDREPTHAVERRPDGKELKVIPETGHVALILALALALALLAQCVLPLAVSFTGQAGWVARSRPAARVHFAFMPCTLTGAMALFRIQRYDARQSLRKAADHVDARSNRHGATP